MNKNTCRADLHIIFRHQFFLHSTRARYKKRTFSATSVYSLHINIHWQRNYKDRSCWHTPAGHSKKNAAASFWLCSYRFIIAVLKSFKIDMLPSSCLLITLLSFVNIDEYLCAASKRVRFKSRSIFQRERVFWRENWWRILMKFRCWCIDFGQILYGELQSFFLKAILFL